MQCLVIHPNAILISGLFEVPVATLEMSSEEESLPLRTNGDCNSDTKAENGHCRSFPCETKCPVGYKPVRKRTSSASSLTCNEDNKERGQWGSKIEFFLAIMGYTVGIGSVWRFPITCSRNGGGAFLIPFFFFLITAGGPLYYMEVCLGQFTGKSAGLAFEFCPLLKG